MCNVGSAPIPKRPTKDDLLGEDPWSNTVINPAFAQDPTGIMRQSDVAAIDAINAAFDTNAIRPASEMLGPLMNPGGTSEAPGVTAAQRESRASTYATVEAERAAREAAITAAEEEKKRVTAWQGENRNRSGRASTLLTGPRGLLNDGTTARRTLLAM